MRAAVGLLLVTLLAGTGCCRLCHRWCDDRDDCRRYGPRERDGCYCAPPPRYSPGCECAPDEERLPPPPTRYDTRSSRPDADPPPRRDDRPTSRQTGAYGGSGN
jgi:hypothetical protein